MSAAEGGLPTVLVVPRSKVSKLLLSRSQGTTFSCVISICDPGQRRPSGIDRVSRRLCLEFHDVVESTEFETAPDRSDVERIVRFAESSASQLGTVLIHCEAGISRSTAAALTIYAVWLGSGYERESVAKVFDAVPEARPNAAMVKYADEVLERGGALVAAVAERFT